MAKRKRRFDYEKNGEMMTVFEKISDKLIASQSFDFDNFKNARVLKMFGDYQIEYDRITLCIYKSNLNVEEFDELSKLLKNKIKAFEKEKLKQRNESVALLHYMEYINDTTTKFSKAVRPDFILNLYDKKVGIEITRFITKEDAVIHRIMDSDYSNSCQSSEELREESIRRHGKTAEQFNYYKTGKIRGIGGAVFMPEKRHKTFADKVIIKYKKYKNSIKDFDEFIILCDADDDMSITCLGDLSEIEELIKKEKFECHFKVVIFSLINDQRIFKTISI